MYGWGHSVLQTHISSFFGYDDKITNMQMARHYKCDKRIDFENNDQIIQEYLVAGKMSIVYEPTAKSVTSVLVSEF